MRVSPIIALVALPFALAGACAQNQTGVTPEGTTQGASSASTAAGGPTTDSSSSGSGGGAATCQGPFCTDASNCGRQGHSCLGGTCAAGLCQAVAGRESDFAANQLVLDASTPSTAASTPRRVRSARVARAHRKHRH